MCQNPCYFPLLQLAPKLLTGNRMGDVVLALLGTHLKSADLAQRTLLDVPCKNSSSSGKNVLSGAQAAGSRPEG
jgi:hypothetical protein